MPKISIVIAVYNAEKYLHKCLDSLVNQTLQDIEIVCVNDGSLDSSLDILNKYAQKDGRFKIISQENQGPGVARNCGVHQATGEYLMIADPDDWFELDACELAYNQITKNKNDMVFFGYQSFYEENAEIVPDLTKLKPFEKIMDNSEINLGDLDTNYIVVPYSPTQIYSMKFILN